MKLTRQEERQSRPGTRQNQIVQDIPDIFFCLHVSWYPEPERPDCWFLEFKSGISCDYLWTTTGDVRMIVFAGFFAFLEYRNITWLFILCRSIIMRGHIFNITIE